MYDHTWTYYVAVSFLRFEYIESNWPLTCVYLWTSSVEPLNVRWCVCRYRSTLRTGGEPVTEDGRHPQGRWPSVKDDLEGLRRRSDGNNSVVRQLQSKIRHHLTHHQCELGVFWFLVLAVFFSVARSPRRPWSWARCPQGDARQTWTPGRRCCFACTPPTDPAPPGPASPSSPSSKAPWHLPKWSSSDYLLTFTG